MTDIASTPVLLVDDRPENLTSLEGLLDDMGLDLFKATSGNEALSLSLKQDFAIVLMDVRMPDMDGYETAELMRSNPKTSRLPIIFVTAAMKDTEHQFKGYEAGAFDYLLKPIEPTILRSKVRVFCELHQQRLRIEQHELQLETLVKERTAELNTALDRMQESEELHRLILTNISDAVFITDDAGSFKFICPNVSIIFGYSYQDVQAMENISGLLGGNLFSPDVFDASRELINVERNIIDKAGSLHTLLVSVKAISLSGGTRLYTCHDISERKRAEEKILRLNEELEERVKDRTRELELRNHDLEQMNKAFVGRELRMVELKERIAELEHEAHKV